MKDMQAGNRLKDWRFWLAFVVQAGLIFGLFWWLSRDVFYQIYSNVGNQPDLGLIVNSLINGLLPIFITQLLVASFTPTMKSWKFWLLMISCILWGLGLAIVFSSLMTRKYFLNKSRIQRITLGVLTTLVIWWVIYQIASILHLIGYFVVTEIS